MSDEYVSKVAISKAITAEALEQNLDSLYDNEASRYQRAAERIVAGMPAADVAPVRHGRWLKHGFVNFGNQAYTGSVECSNCHRFLPMSEDFCLSCGTRMDCDGE